MSKTGQAIPTFGSVITSITEIPPEEVVPGRIYRLGGFIPLDGRITWAPLVPGRYTPHNNFIILDDDRAYLIDTGLAAHRNTVINQIRTLLKPEFPLTAFLTRSEFACSGNLGAIAAQRGLDELVSANRNPFAGSDDISAEVIGSVRRTDVERGSVSPLGSSKDLVVFTPLIRLLSTFWVYDGMSKTLFSADLFGHASVSSPDESVVLDKIEDDDTTYEQVREHTLMRYHWLPLATTEPLLAWLKFVFDNYDIEVIAPTSGRMLKGAAVIKKHYDLIVELFERVPQENI